MAKREKKMSRYNDAKTPTEKPLRNPVGRGQGGRQAQRAPLWGTQGLVPKPQEASQRHFQEPVTWWGGFGDKRGARSLMSQPAPRTGGLGHQVWRQREDALPLGKERH